MTAAVHTRIRSTNAAARTGRIAATLVALFMTILVWGSLLLRDERLRALFRT